MYATPIRAPILVLWGYLHFLMAVDILDIYIVSFIEIMLVISDTAWKVSEYVGFSVPYFPVFSPNTGKYGPEKTQDLDTFHAVWFFTKFKSDY